MTSAKFAVINLDPPPLHEFHATYLYLLAAGQLGRKNSALNLYSDQILCEVELGKCVSDVAAASDDDDKTLVPLISHDKQQARIPQTATLKKSVSGLHLPRLQQISTTQNLAGMPIFTAKLEFGKPTLT